MNRLIILSALAIGISLNINAQTINNRNYYDHIPSGGNLNWLRTSDAVPIIIDELIKNNIAYHTIDVGSLMIINDTTRLVVTVTFDKKDKEYGFLYEASHGIPLNKKDRDFLTDRSKANYVQAERNLANERNFMRIDPLPANVFLLRQTCYWFQYDDSGTSFPVSKEVAQNILRQDIRDYLKRIR